MKIETDMLRVGEPLSFNVYSEDGELLLRQGVVIYNQSQIDVMVERGTYTTDLEQSGVSEQIESLVYRVDIAFNNFILNGWNLVQETQAIALELIHHLNQSPDAMIGITHLRSDLKYSVIRPIQNTIFSVLMAQRLQWKEDRILSLACAALTENIGLYPLQDDLCKQSGGLLEWQQEMVRLHPKQSAKMLITMGVKDRIWLNTIGFHHEKMDGSGYLNGLQGSKIPSEARILSIADRYGAMISYRGTRKPGTPKTIMRAFISSKRGEYDHEFSQHLIAEIGVYPPGATVTLDNGEIAIVIKRQSDRTHPLIYAVADRDGNRFDPPQPRDTRISAYQIKEVVFLEWVRDLNIDLLWGDPNQGGERPSVLFELEEGSGTQAHQDEETTLF